MSLREFQLPGVQQLCVVGHHVPYLEECSASLGNRMFLITTYYNSSQYDVCIIIVSKCIVTICMHTIHYPTSPLLRKFPHTKVFGNFCKFNQALVFGQGLGTRLQLTRKSLGLSSPGLTDAKENEVRVR